MEGGVQALPSLGGTAEPLQMAAVISLHGGILLDWNMALCSLHSTGRDLLIPGETPHCGAVSAAAVTWKGQPGVLGKGRGIGLSMGLALYIAVCSDVCSSSVIHSFSSKYQLSDLVICVDIG